jgi:2-keto-4-pentenoate hydratase
MTELTREQSDILETLTKARLENTTVDPATLAAQDLNAIYDIQAAAFRNGNHQLKGFKLSLRGGVAYSAPLLFVERGTQYAYAAGMAVEPEIALTLSRDLPPRDIPYTRADILDAVGTVSLGIELVRSRFNPAATWPMPLADFLSNIGYVVGPEFSREVLSSGADLGTVAVTADGTALIDQPAKHPDSDPLAAVVVYANSKPGLFGHFKAGQVITTGSVCGIVRLPSSGLVRIELAGKAHELTIA